MGEYAEMMLNGTCCEGCGEFIGSDAGYPQYCSDECAADHGYPTQAELQGGTIKPFECDQCNRTFAKASGLSMHKQAKHPAKRRTCPSCGKKIKGGDYGMQQHQNAKGCGRYSNDLESPVKIANRQRREDAGFNVIED